MHHLAIIIMSKMFAPTIHYGVESKVTFKSVLGWMRTAYAGASSFDPYFIPRRFPWRQMQHGGRYGRVSEMSEPNEVSNC
mmetsp:Transcript_51681/g.107977  ORF Transcript_51681/g.107977 Transcript_51681/m.107977 type:complete len:80 (+) Transcript_51681:441-680(+)